MSDYDWRDDMHRSWLLALDLVRERVARGGKGWKDYPSWRPCAGCGRPCDRRGTERPCRGQVLFDPRTGDHRCEEHDECDPKHTPARRSSAEI